MDYFQLQPDGNFQLYNLEIDPEEKSNLAQKHPDMVKELHSLLNRYRASGRSVPVEQVDADQPTAAVESKSEGDEKPEPESEGRSQ